MYYRIYQKKFNKYVSEFHIVESQEDVSLNVGDMTGYGNFLQSDSSMGEAMKNTEALIQHEKIVGRRAETIIHCL